MKRRIVYLLLSLGLTGLIVYTSLNTGSTYSGIGSIIGQWINRVFFFGTLTDIEMETIVGFGGKFIGHFWLFALTGLFYSLFFASLFRKKNAPLGIVVALGIFLASLGECIQIFTAGRFPSFADVLLNFSGFVFLPLCRLLFFHFSGSVLAREDIVEKDA